jgi:hypothetical protein
MTDHDDPELECLVRASLDTHAGEVDTAVPVGARARAGVRRRRTGRLAVGAAVAAVAAVAVTAVLVERDVPTGSEDTPAVSGPATPGVSVADGWRREYWHGVHVDVPAAWGWGTAPVRTGVDNDDRLYLCGGPGAMRTPAGGQSVNPDDAVAYVGRPIMLSDLCIGGDSLENPKTPYVWLGADLPPGISDVGDGYTQVTVEVAGTTVTVGSDDVDRRKQILASVAAGGPCAPSLDAPPVVAGDDADPGTVCAYRPESDGTYSLVYGAVLDASVVARTEQLVASSPVLTGDCLSPEGGEWVSLAAGGRGFVVDLTCPAITDPDGNMHRLTPAMVRPWAVGGLPATVYGPYGGKGASFGSFIGMLG